MLLGNDRNCLLTRKDVVSVSIKSPRCDSTWAKENERALRANVGACNSYIPSVNNKCFRCVYQRSCVNVQLELLCEATTNNVSVAVLNPPCPLCRLVVRMCLLAGCQMRSRRCCKSGDANPTHFRMGMGYYWLDQQIISSMCESVLFWSSIAAQWRM